MDTHIYLQSFLTSLKMVVFSNYGAALIFITFISFKEVTAVVPVWGQCMFFSQSAYSKRTNNFLFLNRRGEFSVYFYCAFVS